MSAISSMPSGTSSAVVDEALEAGGKWNAVGLAVEHDALGVREVQVVPVVIPSGSIGRRRSCLTSGRHLVEADLDDVGLEPSGELRRRLLVGVEGRGVDLELRVGLEHRVDQLGDDAVLVREHAQRSA